MSFNCPYALEEYKNLDSARHALREEFLVLFGERDSQQGQAKLKNVVKEKLEKMRELHKKCKMFRLKMKNLKDLLIVNVNLAKEIMGEQFYGPEEIENAFGFKVEKDKIPEIPYSREELEKAKSLGERLVLRISEDDEGNPMTMKHIGEITQTRMAKDEGVLLYNSNGWYRDEAFYKKSTLRTEWKLVGGNLIAGSTDKNYWEQTKVLRDYLKGIGSITAEELAECSDENLAIMFNDAKKLAGLKINQNHRRTPGEVLYDWFLHFKKFKDRDYLEENFDWTNIVYDG